MVLGVPLVGDGCRKPSPRAKRRSWPCGRPSSRLRAPLAQLQQPMTERIWKRSTYLYLSKTERTPLW